MNPVAPRSGIDAKVTVAPVYSQNAVVGMLCVAGVALSLGAGLLYADKMAGWAFVVFAIAALGGAVWSFAKSHWAHDMRGAHPTTLTTADGSAVSADARVLRDPDAAKALAAVLSTLHHREGLPEPQGITTGGAVPVPDSADEARRRVRLLNDETKRRSEAAAELLALTAGRPAPLQLPVATDTPGPEKSAVPKDINSPIQTGPNKGAAQRAQPADPGSQ